MSEEEVIVEQAVDVRPSEVVEAANVPEVIEASSSPSTSPRIDTLDLVIDVPLRLTVELGTSRMLLREVLQLGKGAVVDLDRGASEPVDILVNGKIIARGDLTTSEDRLAVRIIEMVQGEGASDERS